MLLDPQDIVIDAAAAAGISASLANSNVTVLTSLHAEGYGNIEVAPGAIVTWSTPTTLTLSAYHDISFLQGSKVANTGAGNLVLHADNTGTGSGTVNFLPARMECVGNCGTPTTPNDPRTPTIPEDPREHHAPPGRVRRGHHRHSSLKFGGLLWKHRNCLDLLQSSRRNYQVPEPDKLPHAQVRVRVAAFSRNRLN